MAPRIQALFSKLPPELIYMIYEFVVIESDPKNRLFWCIIDGDNQDQPLADLLARDHCQYHRLEGQPGIPPWVQRSKEMLRAQYEVYTVIRGNKIRNLVRVSRLFKAIVERHYTFLEPVQKKRSGISSPLGYWINHEHDAIMPATNLFTTFDPPSLPRPSNWMNLLGHLNLRDFTTPPLASSFPWSRVRILHLPDIALRSTKLEEVIPYLPNLEYICIRYSARLYTAICPDESNPHTTTTNSLNRIMKLLTFEEQGSLGVKPLDSSTWRGWSYQSFEVRRALEWCRARGIGIVELDNTCDDCPQYNYHGNALSATEYKRRQYRCPMAAWRDNHDEP
ncbi:hypothetical protein EV127DRAFT_407028 [Xylaria flabelliformis]|nr:hypothetical protein EV127DRAFT_407028 [Xylaria flabelliformis]